MNSTTLTSLAPTERIPKEGVPDMKSFARLAVLASVLPLSALATVKHPLTSDIYAEMVRFRSTPGSTHTVPFSRAAFGTAGLLGKMLETPSSPYSELTTKPDFTNMIWWPAFVERMAGSRPYESVLSTLQWQQGLTKARPGIDVDVSTEQKAAYLGINAAANAIKAGLTPEVYMAALNRHSDMPTVAANEAVAVQLLGELMALVPREKWEANAIRGELYERYTVGGSHVPELTTGETNYLASILGFALSKGGSSQRDGVQQLPAVFRVARAAAAYKDALGFISSRPICDGNAPAAGLPHLFEAASEDPRLCFIAATDRGVLDWYRHEGRREREHIRDVTRRQYGNHDKTGLLTLFNLVMPLMDLAAFVEYAEASVIDDLAASTTLRELDEAAEEASSRTSRLACGVRS
jgi:hypothetical protein